MAASALQAERCLLVGVGAGPRRHRRLLRMPPPLHAPPLLLLLHRRRRRWPPAVRVSPGEGGGGGLAGAVEKRSVMGVVAEEEERGAKVVEEEEGDVEAAALGMRWPPWEGLAERYKLIGATSLAFVICNMDKVNLSVAIIPMSHKYGWNSSTAGLVQSSFFWGYALSQLPGGWLAKLFGGRFVCGNKTPLVHREIQKLPMILHLHGCFNILAMLFLLVAIAAGISMFPIINANDDDSYFFLQPILLGIRISYGMFLYLYGKE